VNAPVDRGSPSGRRPDRLGSPRLWACESTAERRGMPFARRVAASSSPDSRAKRVRGDRPP
jgi:hypothetical protein